MTTTAKSILKQAATTLADADSDRWTVAEMCAYFNAGQNAIRELEPASTTVTAPLALVAGARQTLPAQAAQLLDILGNSNGAGVRQTGRRAMDAQLPSWRALTGQAVIQQWMFDERDETVFYVYPPAAVGASLDVTYSAYPSAISEAYTTSNTLDDVTGNMGLPDKYANALREYVLYRAFAKDGEHPANQARSDRHYGAFVQALGAGTQGQTATQPVKTNPNP